MSRVLLAGLCLGMMLVSVSAGFSATFTQSGTTGLNNGANSLTANGGIWSTSGTAGFTDGQFESDGGYIVPVGAVYHFDAVIQVQQVTNSVNAPDQTVDIRFVKCSSGCNALCTGSGTLATTLLQTSTFYLDAAFDASDAPTYSLYGSFTGSFNTGDIVAVCIDNNASSGAVKLYCPSATGIAVCAFSGFST